MLESESYIIILSTIVKTAIVGTDFFYLKKKGQMNIMLPSETLTSIRIILIFGLIVTMLSLIGCEKRVISKLDFKRCVDPSFSFDRKFERDCQGNKD